MPDPVTTPPIAPRAAPMAVLRLSPNSAEWLGPDHAGRVFYRHAAVAGPGPQALADAAAEVAHGAGLARPRCVLALGGELVRQRLIEIPRLRGAELSAVLERKAAGLLDAVESADVLYAALGGEGPSDAGGESESWLVVGRARGDAIALGRALRERGVRVERVVSARLAHLDSILKSTGESRAACLVIDVEDDEVVVGLLAGHTLVHQNALRGHLASSPALAISLSQEVRSVEAYWRKRSRGEQIERAYVLGLERERGDALGHTLRGVLPKLQITLEPAGPGGPGVGRAASLAACTTEGRFSMNLAAPLPMPKRTARWVAGLSLAVAAGVSGVVWNGARSERRDLSDRTSRVAARSVALERESEGQQQLQREVEGVAARADQLERAGSAGLPMETCMQDVLEAFGQNAALLSMSMAMEDPSATTGAFDGEPTAAARGEATLTVTATTAADPVLATRALARVTERLQESGRFRDVRVEPPAELPERPGASASERLQFLLRARWAGDR